MISVQLSCFDKDEVVAGSGRRNGNFLDGQSTNPHVVIQQPLDGLNGPLTLIHK